MNMLVAAFQRIRKPILALVAGMALTTLALLRLAWQEIDFYRHAPRAETGITGNPVVRAPALPSPVIFLQDTGMPTIVTNNMFHSPHVDRYLAKLAEQKAAQEAMQKAERERTAQKAREESARLAAAEAAARKARALKERLAAVKPTTPVIQTNPVPVPLPRTVQFSYQGLMKISGGPTLALIAIAPPGKTAPYAVGEECAGAVVTNITADQVDLILRDGLIRRAQAGKPESILEVSLHDSN